MEAGQEGGGHSRDAPVSEMLLGKVPPKLGLGTQMPHHCPLLELKHLPRGAVPGTGWAAGRAGCGPPHVPPQGGQVSLCSSVDL